MKQIYGDEIRKELNDYHQNVLDCKEGYGLSQKPTKADIEKEFIRRDTDEEFERIKKSLITSEKELYSNPDMFIFPILPQYHRDKCIALFGTERIIEGYRFEYYSGQSLSDDISFMGLTYALEFPYNQKIFNSKILTQNSGSLVELIEIVNKFNELHSFEPVINNKTYYKEFFHGMNEPADDEFASINDRSYVANMRFFRKGTDTRDFNTFLAYAHKRVETLDTFFKVNFPKESSGYFMYD